MIISMKKFSCLLTFSPERKLAQIQSSTKAGRMPRRFARENLTFGRRRRPISSSMLKVPIFSPYGINKKQICGKSTWFLCL